MTHADCFAYVSSAGRAQLGPAAGFVVANDADAQRCNLLTHHTKRTCSPALVITNHDATLFPIIRDSQVRQN